MSSKKVTVAQIGVGRWGANVARNIAKMRCARLVSVCDSKICLAERAAREWNVRVESDIGRVLADKTVDAVVIATPAGRHFEHTMAALDAGKHVFVEKPMAESVIEAKLLTERADALDLKLMVGHIFLYSDAVRNVKDHIDAGELGDIHRICCRRLNLGRVRDDSDVLWTLGPHDVAIINYWLGESPSRVSARGLSYMRGRSNGPEVCYAEAEFPGGSRAYIHLSWIDSLKVRQMAVVGSEKTLIYDDMATDRRIRIVDKRTENENPVPASDAFEVLLSARDSDILVPEIEQREPLAVEIEHFIDCIIDDTRPFTDGRHGTEVVAVLEAMSTSINQDGKKIAL